MTAEPAPRTTDAAIVLIAERGERKCMDCGKPHDAYWRDPSNHEKGVNWADRDDGHSYRQEPWEFVARSALARLAACAERCEELESELTRQQEMWSAQSRVIGVLAAEVPDDVRARVLAPLKEAGSAIPSLAERCETLAEALKLVVQYVEDTTLTDKQAARDSMIAARAALAKAAPEPEPGG